MKGGASLEVPGRFLGHLVELGQRPLLALFLRVLGGLGFRVRV